MSRVIHDGQRVFVPMALSMDQATATFRAVRTCFMATPGKDLAQAMHELAKAIDKRRTELAAHDEEALSPDREASA